MLTVSTIGELREDILKEEENKGVEDSYLVKSFTKDGEKAIRISAYGFTSAVLKAFPGKKDELFEVIQIHEDVPIKKVILFRNESSTL